MMPAGVCHDATMSTVPSYVEYSYSWPYRVPWPGVTSYPPLRRHDAWRGRGGEGTYYGSWVEGGEKETWWADSVERLSGRGRRP